MIVYDDKNLMPKQSLELKYIKDINVGCSFKIQGKKKNRSDLLSKLDINSIYHDILNKEWLEIILHRFWWSLINTSSGCKIKLLWWHDKIFCYALSIIVTSLAFGIIWLDIIIWNSEITWQVCQKFIKNLNNQELENIANLENYRLSTRLENLFT